MRILIVSQYFEPELTAASLRLGAFATGLAERGHEVEVLAEVPSHPGGVIEPGYRRRLVVRRRTGGYSVCHVYVWARPSKRARTRIANYASFAAAACAVGGLRRRRPDVIVASSPPLSVGLAGMVLAKRFRAPWVLDVRDLWPEVAVALGELGEGPLLSAAERLERRLYRSAAGITVTTEPFRRQISARTDSPVVVVPNGTTRAWLELGHAEADRAGAGLPTDGTYVWTYAGNIGIAQGLESAIDAARELGDGFQLTLLGDGAELAHLRGRAGDQLGRGVVFREPVEPGRAAAVMRASDALLVSLAPQPALEKCVPGKLYQCGAMRRPIIVAAAGETRALAERESAALTVAPGDASGLADAVRRLRDEPATAARLAEGGARLAATSLREEGVLELERLLERVCR